MAPQAWPQHRSSLVFLKALCESDLDDAPDGRSRKRIVVEAEPGERRFRVKDVDYRERNSRIARQLTQECKIVREQVFDGSPVRRCEKLVTSVPVDQWIEGVWPQIVHFAQVIDGPAEAGFATGVLGEQ